MIIFARHVSRLRFLLFSLEFLILTGILYGIHLAVFLYKNGISAYWLYDARQALPKVLIFIVVCQGCMYLNELYDYKVIRRGRELVTRLLQSLGIACILLSLLYLLFGTISVGQSTLLVGLPLIVLSILIWRAIYPRLLRMETLAERVLILGSSRIGKDVIDEIREVKDSGYEVVAVAAEPGFAEMYRAEPLAVSEVFPLQEFPNKIQSLHIDRIVVALGDRRGTLPFRTLLNCRFRGIQVEEGTSFYEGLKGKIVLEDLRPSWFIFSEGFRKSRFTIRVKRLTDIVMAALLLLLSAPMMFVVALLIKIDSKGPVVYKQDRVGEKWKDFTLYKFRSMVQDAEAQGAKWADRDDPRITRVGKVIRKFRIDELPQLFNVIKGDMSFVGPRPERRVFINELARQIPYYPQRLFVKPGVTGWAQVNFHYGASASDTMEKLQYDLYYMKNMSFFFDLSIIFDTIRVVVSGAGAR